VKKKKTALKYMTIYAFRIEHNLMYGTVMITKSKNTAKKIIRANRIMKIKDTVAEGYGEIPCDIYVDVFKRETFPGPGKILKFKILETKEPRVE